MSDNRRQAYRYAVASKEASALLRTSEGEVLTQIVDQSATGFGVVTDKPITIDEGELTVLTTNAGQSICRVMRVEDDADGNTSIGLQRISEINHEPKVGGNTGIIARYLGRSTGSVLMLLAFGLGTGVTMGLVGTSKLPFGLGGGKSSSFINRADVPREPAKRATMLSKAFNSLDELKSRQFIKSLDLTTGQQRKIDNVFEKLVGDLASVDLNRTKLSPEAYSNMGLVMIRRAWVQVEGVLTPEQMTKWDAILDGKIPMPGEENNFKPASTDQAKNAR